MAVTAAITLSSATCLTGQPVAVTCTLTNGGSSDATLVGIQPSKSPSTGPIQLGGAPRGGSFPMSIAASGGTLKVSWTAVPEAPASSNGLASPATFAYSLGAYFQASDGSYGAATPSTLTVSAGN